MDEDELGDLTPEECQNRGICEVDPVYYSLNGNNKVLFLLSLFFFFIIAYTNFIIIWHQISLIGYY